MLEELRLAARESDRVTRALTERANATFVTPIEREDLAALVLVIDALVARAGLGELFSEEPSPIELVRWKDLYERLQTTLAAARRAAATLDMIAVKQH